MCIQCIFQVKPQHYSQQITTRTLKCVDVIAYSWQIFTGSIILYKGGKTATTQAVMLSRYTSWDAV